MQVLLEVSSGLNVLLLVCCNPVQPVSVEQMGLRSPVKASHLGEGKL